MSTQQKPDKVIIYWDYENMPLSCQFKLENFIEILYKNIRDYINIYNIPIELIIYMGYTFVTSGGLSKEFGKGFETLGCQLIIVGSMKPESVDKRIICDMTYQLFEIQSIKQTRVIGLISGDIDYGYLLSKLHYKPGIYKLLLILLGDNPVNHYLKFTPNVDHIIRLNKNHFDTKPRIKKNNNNSNNNVAMEHRIMDKKQNKSNQMNKKQKLKQTNNNKKSKENFEEKFDEAKNDPLSDNETFIDEEIKEDRLSLCFLLVIYRNESMYNIFWNKNI